MLGNPMSTETGEWLSLKSDPFSSRLRKSTSREPRTFPLKLHDIKVRQSPVANDALTSEPHKGVSANFAYDVGTRPH